MKTGKLLLDDHPLVVIPELANRLGLTEAIIIQQVHYWVVKNQGREKNFHEGHYWTYNTYSEWQDTFSFLSERTIRRAIKRLEALGYLVVGNFNRRGSDRTKWYRIDYSLLDVASPSGQNDQSNRSECPGQVDNLDRPLPETNTETSAETIPKEKKLSSGTFNNVFLTDTELAKLIDKFGQDGAVERIDELSHAIASKGYKFKSHYATILNWDRRNQKGGDRGTHRGNSGQADGRIGSSIGRPLGRN